MMNNKTHEQIIQILGQQVDALGARCLIPTSQMRYNILGLEIRTIGI